MEPPAELFFAKLLVFCSVFIGCLTVTVKDVMYLPVSLQDSWTCPSKVQNSQLGPSYFASKNNNSHGTDLSLEDL